MERTETMDAPQTPLVTIGVATQRSVWWVAELSTIPDSSVVAFDFGKPIDLVEFEVAELTDETQCRLEGEAN